ncbi:MAG TPA: DnaB-like helicase N-terminal domain-containing protein [Mycobacteriales bacterium]|nr:DnaB-like helicase N-terminal domain-containing protein [Mycobacteriales bacterium]
MTTTLDPEYATVGGLLLAPSLYAAVDRWLRREDFAGALSGEIYELIGDMRGRGVPVDPVTVLGELRQQGRVRPDGYPATELVAMVQSVPVPEATPYYGRLVLEAAVFRRVAEYGVRLTQIGELGRGTPEDAFEALSQSWRSLADLRRRWQEGSEPACRSTSVEPGRLADRRRDVAHAARHSVGRSR